jgi:hypothetical protein
MAWEFTVDMPSIKGVPQAPYRITKLLGNGQSNAKLAKSELFDFDILSYGLSLAPSKASGYNLCPHASAGCIKGCLEDSGQAIVFPKTIKPPRIAKSRLLRKFPDVFEDRLMTELNSAQKRAWKLKSRLFVRLNVFSDVVWENEMPGIFDAFKDIQFYDYTKDSDRFRRYMDGKIPSNYHLTFSRSENNWSDCVEFLRRGFNVAVPFHVKYNWKIKQPLPPMFEGWEVIDGDISDLRPFDPSPHIVGLRVKGPKAKKDFTTLFVIDPATLERGAA